MKRFVYNSKSFCHSTTTWSSGQTPALSLFDRELMKGWDSAMDNGHFRYKIDQMKTRIVPGQYKYVLQLNELRGTERRKPEHINHVRQPFNPEKFNFTKIQQNEVLFQFCPEHDHKASSSNNVRSGSDQLTTNGCSNHDPTEDSSEHLVIINVSPLEYGHVLLVPHVKRQLPQLLTEEALCLGIEMLLLSEHRGFRVGYNSLCAYASVNHLHLHGWYLNHQIGIEFLPVKEVGDLCHVTQGWPAPAFVFQLLGTTVEKLSRRVHVLVRHLQEENVAHNVLIVRGVAFGEPKDSSNTTVRIFVWPRASFVGAKNEGGIALLNPAVAELGGHVPMYIKDQFPLLTEKDILSIIQDCLLAEDTFRTIQDRFVRLLSQTDTDRCRNGDHPGGT